MKLYALLTYAIVITLVLLYTPVTNDSYYYWQWGQHLQLSYYDGPPLIGYVLRLFSSIFGDSKFSFILLNLLSLLITACCLYQIAKRWFSLSVVWLSIGFWLLAPGVMHYLILQTTYNSLMVTFWAGTLYAFIQLIETRAVRWYYLTAVCMGLLLLSHYTGILICLSLIIYLLYDRSSWQLIKTWHFYAALFVFMVLISPVIIWNQQHDWISFQYQLHHGFHHTHNSIASPIRYLLQSIFNYGLVSLIYIYFLMVYWKEIIRDKRLMLLFLPSGITWLFFLIGSFFSPSTPWWNAPFFFTTSLLTAYFVEKTFWSKTLRIRPLLLCSSGLISILVIVIISTPYLEIKRHSSRREAAAVQQFLQQHPLPTVEGNVLFAEDRWLASLLSYYSPKHPLIYVPSLDFDRGGQNYLWWQEHTTEKKVVNVWYITTQPALENLNILKGCNHIPNKILMNSDWQFFIYQCHL